MGLVGGCVYGRRSFELTAIHPYVPWREGQHFHIMLNHESTSRAFGHENGLSKGALISFIRRDTVSRPDTLQRSLINALVLTGYCLTITVTDSVI